MTLFSPLAKEARGQDMPLPMGLQVSVLSRVWAFDRAQSARMADELVVGVVYQERHRSSLLAKEQFLEELEATVGRSTHGSVRVVLLDTETLRDFAERIAQPRVDIIYVTPLRAVDVRRLASLTRAAGVLSCTGVPDYVAQGLAVGVGMRDGRPEILVNRDGAKAEGADFSAQFLAVARLVGGDL